jgi:serine/threonine-protein kinase
MSAMSMTATGTVLGTPYYLSPEQARGNRDIDHRSDLYTVGVIMYQSVAGRVPVHAESFNELLFKIALESPPPLASFIPQLDPTFSKIVEKAMSRKREDRYQSAREMRHALAQWLELPTSGAHVPAPGGSGLRPSPWESGETVTGSRLVPTNSNFGSTAVSPFRRSSPLKGALIALAVLGVVGVSAALILKRGSGGSSTAAPAISSSPVVAPPSASAPAPDAPIVIAPADPPPLAEPSDSDPVPGVGEDAPRDTGPLSGLRARPRPGADEAAVKPRPQSRPAAAPRAPAAATPAPAPAPAPATSAKRRRDFGY